MSMDGARGGPYGGSRSFVNSPPRYDRRAGCCDTDDPVAVMYNKNSLRVAQEGMKSDFDYCLKVIQGDVTGFDHVSDKLKRNFDFAIQAVQTHGSALQYLPAFCDDEEVVAAAVRQNGMALKYASEAKRASPEIVTAAIKNNGLALDYVSKALQDDKEIVLEACSNNGHALQFASEALRADLDVILCALTTENFTIEHVSDKLRFSKSFKKLLASHLLFIALMTGDDKEAARAVKAGASYTYLDGKGLRLAAERGFIDCFTKICAARPMDNIMATRLAVVAKQNDRDDVNVFLLQQAESYLKGALEAVPPKPLKLEVGSQAQLRKNEEHRWRWDKTLPKPIKKEVKKVERPPYRSKSYWLALMDAEPQRGRRATDSTRRASLSSQDRFLHAVAPFAEGMMRRKPADACREAAKGNRMGILMMSLTSPERLDVRDGKGWTPAHWAAHEGKVAVIRTLASLGVDRLCHRGEVDGKTPAHVAAQRGHYQVLEVLMEFQADWDTEDHDGCNPLLLAAQHGHVKCLILLINSGAKLDNKTRYGGQTALHVATKSGHAAALDVLCTAMQATGRRLDVRDHDGNTPADLAKQLPEQTIGRGAVLEVLNTYDVQGASREKFERSIGAVARRSRAILAPVQADGYLKPDGLLLRVIDLLRAKDRASGKRGSKEQKDRSAKSERPNMLDASPLEHSQSAPELGPRRLGPGEEEQPITEMVYYNQAIGLERMQELRKEEDFMNLSLVMDNEHMRKELLHVGEEE